jgi:hypothetical protein
VATTTTNVEQVVRTVLNDVLTQVSDALASETGELPTGATNGAALAYRGAPADTEQPPTDEITDEGEGEGEDQAIPPAVLAAVAEVSRELSPEQANALAAMFTALSGEQEDGDIEAQPAEFGVVEALPDGRGAKAPNGWFCLYQYPNYSGRMLKFNAGTNDLSKWGFRNKGSSYINNTRRTIRLINTDPIPDKVITVRPGERNAKLGGQWDNRVDTVIVR